MNCGLCGDWTDMVHHMDYQDLRCHRNWVRYIETHSTQLAHQAKGAIWEWLRYGGACEVLQPAALKSSLKIAHVSCCQLMPASEDLALYKLYKLVTLLLPQTFFKDQASTTVALYSSPADRYYRHQNQPAILQQQHMILKHPNIQYHPKHIGQWLSPRTGFIHSMIETEGTIGPDH